ncbi:NUDIX domain-containing protein [Candidatus Parcubacteria bacterium]|nr:NUDIX domain-containing protein [Candidatus Parcubacteria bacterium]
MLKKNKNVKKLPFSEFKNIYSKVPRLCVEIILKIDKGIALTKRNIQPAKGKWHIPGGTVLKGENLKDTVKRVAQEELGEIVKIKKMIGVIEYSFKNYFSQPIGIAFLVCLGSNVKKNKLVKYKLFKKMPSNIIKDQMKFITKYKDKIF